MRVYLAGPIASCNDYEAQGWRDVVKVRLAPEHEVVDPMVRDYRGVEDPPVKEIVEQDKLDIFHSQAVLAHVWKRSVGTIMEIHYAWSVGRWVVTVLPPSQNSSIWLTYHSTVIVPDIQKGVEAVRKLGTNLEELTR